MKTDKKARFQGYKYYFKEGFCWTDINSTYLKSRLKGNGVFDVVSMSLFSKTDIPEWYFVTLINSTFISFYVDNFINNTSHFQINDARQLPIIIPTADQLDKIRKLFNTAVEIKKKQASFILNISEAENQLNKIQEEVDALISCIYKI